MRFCVPVLSFMILFVNSVPAQTDSPPSWKGSYHKFLDELFSYYDKDGDGVIKKSELEEMKLPVPADSKPAKSGQGLSRRLPVGGASGRSPEAAQLQREAAHAKQLKQLFGGKNSQALGAMMASDGKIRGGVFGGATSSKRKASSEPIPKSVAITFVALELPQNFARNEMVTLKEMASGLAGGVKESELEKIGIRLLDLYELSVVDGKEAQLNFEQAKQMKDAVYDNRQRSYVKFNLGSTLSVTPQVYDSGIALQMNYSTSNMNKNDRGIRQVGTMTRLLLTEKNRTKLINLYNEGVHYLLIVSAKVQ